MTEDQTETAIRTTSYVHLPANTRVTGMIRTQTNGDRYMVLDLSAQGVGDVTFFIHDPEFLDKLANEAERLCREFVGDVPGGQATLTSAITREPVNFTFPEPTTVVVP